MSRRRVYSKDTLAIMERFYQALDLCKANKLIKSITAFCNDNNIDKRHFYAQRKDLNKGFFEVSWLIPLVKECGISSLWLLSDAKC